MAITFHIDRVNERIYSRATGIVTFDDMLSHMNAEVGDEVAGYAEILDCRNASTDLSVQQVHQLAEARRKIAEERPVAPVAIVATNDVFFGMLRVFDMLTDTIRPLRVFRDIAEAERWLDSTESHSPENSEGKPPHLSRNPQ